MTQQTDVDILTQAGKPVVPGSVTGIGRAPGAETEIPRPRAHPLHGRLRGPGPGLLLAWAVGGPGRHIKAGCGSVWA